MNMSRLVHPENRTAEQSSSGFCPLFPSSQKLQTMILEITVNLVLSAHIEHKQSSVTEFPETADHDTGNHGQPGSKCSHRTQTVICQCPSSQKLKTMILEIMVNLVLSAHIEHKQSSVSFPVPRY